RLAGGAAGAGAAPAREEERAVQLRRLPPRVLPALQEGVGTTARVLRARARLAAPLCRAARQRGVHPD
ncbi:hypothetical protein HK405_002131, partial [Cladochytrium tenue]